MKKKALLMRAFFFTGINKQNNGNRIKTSRAY